jgi:S1-C subfamily serine protease
MTALWTFRELLAPGYCDTAAPLEIVGPTNSTISVHRRFIEGVNSMRTGFLSSVAIVFFCAAWANANDAVTNSVVKIHTTRRQPDFERPWSKAASEEISGSGVIIEGKRILTNAHVVTYASQIFVQADKSTERVPAKVKAIAPAMDLAVIEVEKPSFFDGRPPIPIADALPALKQTVNVYGYPTGGEQLSITQGIVSRIEFTNIYYGARGLRIQIDAAVNPGNSGGPALSNGKIAGLVFSKFAQGENIGYLIAADEIREFLESIKSGTYIGKPQLWDHYQPAENEALRAKLGLKKQTGLVVATPFSNAPDYPLKRGDVITHIGDKPLDNEGNVNVNDSLRLSFLYFVPKLAKEGRVKLTIVRDRKSLDVQVPVRCDGNYVMPYLMNRYPRYFVYGPMVFMPAYQDLAVRLAYYGKSWVWMLVTTQSPLLSRETDHPAFNGEEIVTIGYRFLPHKTAQGYHIGSYSVVSRVNGTAVRNLAHLVELLRDAKGEFLTIDLAGAANPSLVFRRDEVVKATEDILSDEGIRKQYSDDLEPVWHPKK